MADKAVDGAAGMAKEKVGMDGVADEAIDKAADKAKEKMNKKDDPAGTDEHKKKPASSG